MDTASKTRCEVIDQIIEWTAPDGALQIEQGDLIVFCGRFEVIASVSMAGDNKHIKYKLDGSQHKTRYARVEHVVAVRRYIETTEE